MIIEIRKTEEGFDFVRVDDFGDDWDLGHANLGEDGFFDGYFDTKRISFENVEQCIEVISRRKPGEIIIYTDKADPLRK